MSDLADHYLTRLGPRKWAYGGTVYATRKEARAAWYHANRITNPAQRV